MTTAPRPDRSGAHHARFWHAVAGDRIVCDLCPHACRLGDGQRGLCFVRAREGDRMVLTTYGRSSGFAIDPIEKKPLYHFHPGTSVLSFGTAGCNLRCKFCQNWDISRARAMDRLADRASPAQIARAAKGASSTSVAFTYNEPIVFAEYAMDTADACHEIGVLTVAVTAGYISDGARADFFAKMDAANVDLKAFTEDFYEKQTASTLGPVKDTIRYLARETSVWTEVTTLVIPGLNDSEREIAELSAWLAGEAGPDVPLHFSAFHPAHEATGIPPTPTETLRRAREIALREGLHHVYTGNVHDVDGGTTFCPRCRAPVIVRDWYDILDQSLGPGGRCGACGHAIAGRFGDTVGAFGNQRVRVKIE
jgi:pyruvate formate lyase activating enzyme